MTDYIEMCLQRFRAEHYPVFGKSVIGPGAWYVKPGSSVLRCNRSGHTYWPSTPEATDPEDPKETWVGSCCDEITRQATDDDGRLRGGVRCALLTQILNDYWELKNGQQSQI